jgi:hypothetical protein
MLCDNGIRQLGGLSLEFQLSGENGKLLRVSGVEFLGDIERISGEYRENNQCFP